MADACTDSPLLGERFDAALLLATAHHRRQLRKGTDVPYVAHLLAVASLALEMGASEDEAIAALLHDLVEDGGGPQGLQDIRRRFGDDVARIVHANSDTDQEPKPPWQERKEAYIAAIAQKQPDELRVSLADRLHNARAILLDYRTEASSCGRASGRAKARRCGGTTGRCTPRSRRAARRSAPVRSRRSASMGAWSTNSRASPRDGVAQVQR